MKANMNFSKLLNTYSRYQVEFVKGEGPYLIDNDGKEYIDFLCGIAVNGFGHNHPEIKAAVQAQLDNYWHLSNLYISSGQEELAKKLTEKSGMDYVFFSNSGTEAVEAGLKFARKWGKEKFEIISTLNSFHGRTFGSLSATGQPKFWEGFSPMVPGFKHVAFGSIEAVNNAMSDNTAAVIVETIQGEGGVNVSPADYIKKLRALCSEKGILLIIDEVQTGMGRTGKFFSYLHYDIKPDIVTSAKGIANGIPLGATLCSEEVAACIKPGSHGSTFGGNPLSIAAANKVVDLLDEKTLNYISDTGNIIMNGLHGLHMDEIKEIRGKGLIIGIEMQEGISSKIIASNMLKRGILVGTSGESVVRLLPPFIIAEKEISKFLLTFKSVVSEVSVQKV